MATGISIHVGVNATKAPGLSVQPLVGCENDAEAMRVLARARNFVAVDGGPDVPIIREKATFENVLGKIRLAAEKLVAGDIFLFTFSGHGTRRGADDPAEEDLKDETLVLHDKLLVDNVLRRRLWPTFKAGVRVVMVSDSCHSGGIAMSVIDDSESEPETESSGSGSSAAWARDGVRRGMSRRGAVPGVQQGRPQNGFGVRGVSEAQAQAHFNLLKQFYKELRESLPSTAPPVPANVLLLAACQEHETTRDGLPNGVFTRALLEVLSSNGTKTYTQLRNSIEQKLQQASATNHPVLLSVGQSAEFADTEAFRI
ncbi:MAG TPA: caspase family protein [Pyrinomonadaceae bacterium]|nr:caspase family protein [Pyrinomonadaceae bacterium]